MKNARVIVQLELSELIVRNDANVRTTQNATLKLVNAFVSRDGLDSNAKDLVRFLHGARDARRLVTVLTTADVIRYRASVTACPAGLVRRARRNAIPGPLGRTVPSSATARNQKLSHAIPLMVSAFAKRNIATRKQSNMPV